MSDTKQAFPDAYSDFVRSRFKTDLPGNGAALLHAAIGISGEVAELLGAHSRKNIIEECGDLEFYLEAAWQQIGGERCLENDAGVQSFSDYLPYLVIHTGDFLDSAKKVWIYNKPMEAANFCFSLAIINKLLLGFYEFLGTTQEEVQRLNMEKLLKRYPTGYSDAAAIARADKQEGV